MPILERERVRSARLRLVWRLDTVSCNEAMGYALVKRWAMRSTCPCLRTEDLGENVPALKANHYPVFFLRQKTVRILQW